MTRVPDERGRVHPVTVVQAGPCVVLQVKTVQTDGYDAVQIGFVDQKPHRSTLPMIGHAGKAGTGPKRWIREIRLAEPCELSPGDVLTVSEFLDEPVTYVDVTGVTKGRGFAGVVRRWNFGGQPATHGVKRKHRSPGSVGGHASGNTGRGIKKGKRMGGHMGDVRCTVRGQKILRVDVDHGLLLIRGAIPGPNGHMVMIQRSGTKA